VDEEIGAAIDPRAVAKRVDQAKPRFESVNPESDMAALGESKAEFLRGRTMEAPYTKIAPSLTGETGYVDLGQGVMKYLQNLTPLEAQNLKQGTYRVLGDKAFTGELKAAAAEGQKALARGLKEEIEAVFPEIKSLNAREGSLIELQNALNRFVSREANHQMTGIGTPLVAIAGATTAGAHTGIALGAIRAVLEAPAIKSKIAIALTRAGAGKSATLPNINARLATLKAAIEASVSKIGARGQSTEGLTPELAQ
jgi:hypothetical protein